MPPQPAGDKGRRSASQKRIENYAARRTPRLDGRLDQLLRIGGVVFFVADFGRNPPDRPFVPALKVISGFRTCRMFRLSGYSVRLIPGLRFELLPEVVFRGFGEEKHLLEIRRKTVFDGSRYN